MLVYKLWHKDFKQNMTHKLDPPQAYWDKAKADIKKRREQADADKAKNNSMAPFFSIGDETIDILDFSDEGLEEMNILA